MIQLIRLISILTAFVLSSQFATARPTDGAPSIESAVHAWIQLRDWITSFSLPAPGDPDSNIEVEGATACCVILRQNGRVVGVGTSEHGGGEMIRQAAARALVAARADPAIAALPEDIRTEVGGRLTVELEIAGPLEPLIGNSISEFQEDIHPLHHGLAIRWKDDWIFRYPSYLRLANAWAEPSRLEGMAVAIGLSPAGFKSAMGRGESTAYRFQTIDLAQVDPDAQPRMVVAGSAARTVPRPDIETLVEARSSLLKHLHDTWWPGEEELGLMGTYNPATDSYEPIIASALDQSLAAWAMAHAAASADISPDDSRAAVERASGIIAVLAARDSLDDATPIEDAGMLLALDAVPGSMVAGDIPAIRTRILERLRNTAATEIESPETNMPGHDMALVSFALAGREDEVDRQLARGLAEKAWDATPLPKQVSLLPWIAWTEQALAESTGEPIARSDDLRALRRLLSERQVPPFDEQFGSELAGGHVLGRSPTDVTSQSLRPVAALPSLLRHDELTLIEERPEQQARLLAAMQFLLRSMVTEDAARLHRNPGRSMGGIRTALWDNRMPPAAQAMGLMALSETIELLKSDSIMPQDAPGLY